MMKSDITKPTIAAVHTALTAVEQALDAEERQLTVRALVDAGVALVKRRDFLYCEATEEGWLPRNWLRLENLVLTLPPDEFKAKEEIWRSRLDEYEESIRALDDARTTLTSEGQTLEVKQGNLEL